MRARQIAQIPLRLAADQFSSVGRLAKQDFAQAPALRPVDYLHGVRILAATADYLFGVPDLYPGSLYKYDRATYTGTLVYAFGTTGGRAVVEVIVQDRLNVWVEWTASTVNSRLYRLTATDATWASVSITNTLYVGGDDVNAAETNTLSWATDGSATATLVGYRLLSHASMTFDAAGNAWVAEYGTGNEPKEYVSGRVLVAGDFVRPSTPNGHYYIVGAAGGTAGAEPAWPTVRGQSVVSGATFYCAADYAALRMRVLKLAAGASTWTVEWTANAGAVTPLCRHLHCIRYNAYTGALWLSAGDTDKWLDGAAVSSTTTGPIDNTWLMSWDMAVALPANPTIASLAAASGVKIWSGSQRYRAVDFTFNVYGGFYWSDADPSMVSTYHAAGIYKVAHDLSSVERIGTPQAQGELASGYYGIKTPAGNLVFVPATSVNSTFTERQVPLMTASANGTDVAYAGVVTHVAGTTLPYGLIYDDVSGYCFVSISGMAGKGTPGRQTVVFQVLDDTAHNLVGYDGQKIDRAPAVLHPVYWVKSTGTDDTTGDRGYTPRNPWATLNYALTGSRVTPGGRVVVLDAALSLNSGITCAWTANANPGDSALKLEIDLRGVAAVLNVNNAAFSWAGSSAMHIRLLADSWTYGPSTGGSTAIFGHSSCSAACHNEIADSLVGYLGHSAVTGAGLKPASNSRIVYAGPGSLTITRSRVPFLAGGEIALPLSTKAASFKVIVQDSAIDDASYLIQWSGTISSTDDNIEINNSFIYARTYLAAYGGGGSWTWTGTLRAKDSALISGGSALLGGTYMPASLASQPLKNCVTNAPLGPTITTPEVFDTNAINTTEVMYVKTVYVPRDPGQGDWRDDRYAGVGPRVPLPVDPWLRLAS